MFISMKNMPNRPFIAAILFLASPLMAAQNDFQKTGEVAASFLKSSPSVRHAALGGEQVALAEHVDDSTARSCPR
jgi:hypothetical protein